MKKYILCSLSLITLVSCRKDKTISFCELHPEECVDIREVKEYFYFKLGSYWLYQEENSGQLDFTYVVETFSDSGTYYFDTKLHSDFDTYDYRYWPGGGATTDENIVEKSKRSTIIYKAKTKPGDFVSESYCFPFYPYEGNWVYSYGGEPYGYNNILSVFKIYDSLEIVGKEFSDVVCLYEEHTASENKQPTYHYYAKGVGLIKKELVDSNQIWNLIDYHIEY